MKVSAGSDRHAGRIAGATAIRRLQLHLVLVAAGALVAASVAVVPTVAGGQASPETSFLFADDLGARLETPRHHTRFTADGVNLVPAFAGPEWSWQLESIRSGTRRYPASAVRPWLEGPETVVYPRLGGAIVEQYLVRSPVIEQQFVILWPLEPEGDLEIVGEVRCGGRFETMTEGWRWRDERGMIHLGDVTVRDAGGRLVEARMTVTADRTTISIPAAALAAASYPVTIDPEIGADDFRISTSGPDGDSTYTAEQAAVAYNSTEHEYLVVWAGTDDVGGMVLGEREVLGQLIDAQTGAAIGENFRISFMGGTGDPAYGASDPAVAYNPDRNEYLVVWVGDDNAAGFVNYENEIWARRVSAIGELLGSQLRLSDMGPTGVEDYDAFDPAVAYDSIDGHYLVVWRGDDDQGGMVDEEFEIFGQLVAGATGAQVGANDFRISDVAGTGVRDYRASEPQVAWDGGANRFLVVWEANDPDAGLDPGKVEIFGQLLEGATGAEVGANDFRLSVTEPDADTTADAADPAVAYSGRHQQYLVVWLGSPALPGWHRDESEIFGQRFSADGTPVDAQSVRLSVMGEDGDSDYGPWGQPAVCYNHAADEYLVVWHGMEDLGLAERESEIFGRWVDARSGRGTGAEELRISTAGPDGNGSYGAHFPAVAASGRSPEALVVWHAVEILYYNTPPSPFYFPYDDREIFGQRLLPEPFFADGFESGGLGSWSSSTP